MQTLKMKNGFQNQMAKLILALIFCLTVPAIHAAPFFAVCPKTSYEENEIVTLTDGSEINCFYSSQGKLTSAQTKPCYYMKSCILYNFHPNGSVSEHTVHFPRGFYERRYNPQGMLIGKTRLSIGGRGEECRYIGNYQLKCEYFDSNNNLIDEDYIGVEYLNY